MDKKHSSVDTFTLSSLVFVKRIYALPVSDIAMSPRNVTHCHLDEQYLLQNIIWQILIQGRNRFQSSFLHGRRLALQRLIYERHDVWKQALDSIEGNFKVTAHHL